MTIGCPKCGTEIRVDRAGGKLPRHREPGLLKTWTGGAKPKMIDVRLECAASGALVTFP